jgi:hypothetical protein
MKKGKVGKPMLGSALSKPVLVMLTPETFKDLLIISENRSEAIRLAAKYFAKKIVLPEPKIKIIGVSVRKH